MLEKPEKFFGQNSQNKKDFLNFGFLGVLRPEGCGLAPAGPKTGQNPSMGAKKRVLGKTLGRQKKFYIVFILKSDIFEGARPF